MLRTFDGNYFFLGSDAKTAANMEKAIDRSGVERVFPVPCRKCLACRANLVRDWTIRCVHEAQLHDHTSFVTLTYNDENLPLGGRLEHRHFQLFMKSLRTHFKRAHGVSNIRFFMAGEYGERGRRPHYHAILFGCRFDDAEFHGISNGNHLFRSDQLDKLWGRGHALFGEATRASMQYTSAYSSKHLTMGSERAALAPKGTPDPAYPDQFADFMSTHSALLGQLNASSRGEDYVDTRTGEIVGPMKPYCRASNRPGIGARWMLQHHRDCLKGFVTDDGSRFPVPKYYQRLVGRLDPTSRQVHERERERRILLIDELDPPSVQDLERMERFNEAMHLRSQTQKLDKL
jgi:hypothetical protein